MWLKQLFCKHHYSFVGEMALKTELPDKELCDVPVQFFECSKCGKRKIIRFHKCCYNSSMLEHMTLWEKGQLNFEFKDGGKEGIFYA